MRGVLAVLFVFAGHLSVGFRVARREGSVGAEGAGGGRRRERRRREPRRRSGRSRSPSPSSPPSPPTPPSPPSPPGDCHEFLFIGDFGYRKKQQADVAKGLAKVAEEVDPTAIFAMGDNIYYIKDNEVDEYMVKSWYDYYPKVYSSLRRPWYGMTGNHDWEADARGEVKFTNSSKNKDGYWNMPDLYYKKSFKTGSGTSIDFLIIDSEQYKGKSKAVKKVLGSKAQGDHKDWLDKELERSSADWKVVLGHHPPYLWTRSRKKVNKESHSGLPDVLKKHNVPMYGSAHFHHLGIMIGDNGIRSFLSGAGATKGKGGKTECLDNPQSSDKNNLAYCDGLGFARVKFCDKSEAEISLYDGDGKLRHTVKSPNTNRMSMLGLEENIPSAENISMSLPPSVPFVPYTADDDRKILCKGLELVEVDRVCARDHCLVQMMRMNEPCEVYCAISGLACLGGWMQADEADDCEPSVNIGCQHGKIHSVHNKICQCG